MRSEPRRDDFRSRSRDSQRSIRYRNRSHSPKHGRRSPHESQSYSSRHDRGRTPPKGPASTQTRYQRPHWKRHGSHSEEDRPYYGRTRSPPLSPRDREYDDRRSRRRRSRSFSPSRSRSRSGIRERSRERRTLFKGPPSRDLIMEGVPGDMKENDIKSELQKHYSLDGLEDIRVIRDRSTGLSRQFGFLQFSSIESSQDFLKNYGPELSFSSPGNGTDAPASWVRIANTRQPDDEWKCNNCKFSNFSTRNECFRCKDPKNGKTMPSRFIPSKPSDFANCGDQDVATSGVPSQYLIFRGLDSSVTETMLAKGASKLYKTNATESVQLPNNKSSGSKVASTTSDSNFGARADSIFRVLLVRDRRSDESWRFGFVEFMNVDDAQAALLKFNAQDRFTIASKPIDINFIHTGVFVPAWNYAGNNIRYTFGLANNLETRLAYWDDDAYVQELVINERPTATENLNTTPPQETLSTKQIEQRTKKRKGNQSTQKSSDDNQSNKKAAPAHLQFWSNRHAELHGIAQSTSESNEVVDEPKSSKQPDFSLHVEAPQSFADRQRKCCLLCSRQFKSDAEVYKHERLSQLHRDNLKNEDLKEKALQKLAKTTSNNADEPSYRDRAKERRQAFNQPKQPAPQNHSNQRKAETSSAGSNTTRESEIVSKPAESKGASLLGKMGWTKGEGLGAHGTGVTAPVQTDVYAQGVGLGAQGGKLGDAAEEALRNTRGEYGDFVSKMKDKAKERFESLKN